MGGKPDRVSVPGGRMKVTIVPVEVCNAPSILHSIALTVTPEKG